MALEDVLGPRIPQEEWRRHRARYILPTVLFVTAAVLLVVSFFLPYWQMRLYAPQYPKGLVVTAYLNRLTGDVREVDTLNHYIGMRPLNEAAQLERRSSALMLGVLALLLLGAVFVHNWWAALLAAPAVLFPAGFFADLYYWLATFGTNLDPRAPLSGAIKPFVPPVLGEGRVGQFRTVASPGSGWWVALGAALLVLLGLWCHRLAFKPLVERRRREAASAPGPEPADIKHA